MEKEVSGKKIKVVQGDISDRRDCEAVVNAANAQLETGGGVAGAIHRAAGPGLAEEARKQAPISAGEAVITGAHSLPNKYVIHCLGPVYGKDKPEDKLLANCYRNALELANSHDISSIAFPALSTGAFGYPTEEAAKIAFRTIINKLPQLDKIKRVEFVLYSEPDLKIHEQIFAETVDGRR